MIKVRRANPIRCNVEMDDPRTSVRTGILRSLAESSRQKIADWLGLGSLIGILFLAGVFFAARRSMWLDEIYSYLIITQPSFSAMWATASDLIGTVPLYYVVGWLWTKLAGQSEAGLRLLSTLCMSGSVALIYLTIRKQFKTLAVFLGVGSAFLLSQLILVQNVEIRFYGLYLLLASIHFAIFEWLTRANSRTAPRFAVLFILTFAALFEHLFALDYSAAALAVMIGLHLYRRQRLPYLLYAAVPLAWVAVAVCWYQPFITQNTHFNGTGWWAAPPAIDALLTIMGVNIGSLFVVMCLFVAAMVFLDIANRAERVPSSPEMISDGRVRLLSFALAFFLVPVGAWMIAHAATPAFEPRYFIPSIIAYAIVFTYLVDRLLLPRLQDLNLVTCSVVAAYVAVLFGVPFLQMSLKSRESLLYAEDAKLDPALPIVTDDFHDFVARSFYAGDRNRYLFINDPEAASEGSGPGPRSDWAYALTLAKLMPERFVVVTTETLLTTKSRFFVLHNPKLRWLDLRLAQNHAFTLSYLGAISISDPLPRWVFAVQKVP